MKKSIFILFMAAFMVGSLGTGCKTNSEKKAEEEENVTDAAHEAHQDARIEKEEQQTKIDQAEWDNFKKEIDAKMNANEILINDLKAEVKKSGNKYDVTYVSTIDSLEKQNVELRGQMNQYDKNKKGWDEFKSRFNKDIDALGKKLDELKSSKKK